MHTTNLRKVGGSVMLAVPPAVLDILQLGAGAAVNITVDGNRLVMEAQPRPGYTLAELLAASDYPETLNAEDRNWIDAPAAGREIL